MDYDELEGGRRREGSFAACGSWINKVGMAVGAGVSFFILGWLGLEDPRPAVQPEQAGEYRVVVSGAAGSVTSDPVRVTVDRAAMVPTAPSILTQPASVAVAQGQPAVLGVGVAGSGPFSYAWRKDGTLLPAEKRAQLVIGAATAASAGTYAVTIANAAGSVTSAPATVSLAPEAPASGALAIAAPPLGMRTTVGEAVSLSVGAVGGEKLMYQWLKDGTPLQGATEATLTLRTSRQPAHTIFMIRLLFAAIPIIGLMFSLIALTRFPLTQEKMAEIRQQLEARRGKV